MRRYCGIEKGSLEILAHLHANHFQSLAIDQVGLGEHRHTAPHRQQANNVEVLAGLRLDRLLGRDHQQHQVDAADTGQHVAHEALMPGNIDKSNTQGFARGRGQIEIGKADDRW